MQTAPDRPTTDEVRTTVREHWDVDAAATYVPLGFGAHHWRVADLFVTLDGVGSRHTAETLEATYAGASALAAQGLEFVLAPLPSRAGDFTVPLADGRLSVTPWVDAPRAGGPADAELLARLHAALPPQRLRRWQPLVGPDLAEELARRTIGAWDGGPHAEAARTAIRESLDAIEGWVAAYHHAALRTDPATWVATHGEPHERNLLVSPDGPLLVDWESLMVAPAERDLHQAGLPGDPELLGMFDLEWRLDEISQYAAWFAQPHGDTDDDRTALGGLLHELGRDPRDTTGSGAQD